MKLITVAAQLANGKDEFCNYLAKVLNDEKNEWERNAFADAVKNTFCQAFNVDRDFIEKWKRIPEAPPGFLMPIRQCLQFIGDGYRKIRDEIWIEIALRGERNQIISDSRYFNEAKAVCQRNGLVFLMYRPGFVNDDPNPSESQIRPLVDFCVKNICEGPIDFKALKEKYGDECPDEMKYYHYWLVNDSTLSDLRHKTATKVVPFVEEFFRKM
mgnify:CR=1 FL=1